MYCFENATLVAENEEDLKKMIEPYRKYPFFSQGPIHKTLGKFVHQGKVMVIVNYFNND